MSLRFTDLDPLGRTVIVVVAALTLAVAATAFATSYGALYAYARDSGLYSERLARIWPLLLDGAFIVAQLASVLAGILRGSRGWPVLTMLTCGSLTVWFNIQHAGVDPGRRLAAVIPPVLMILAFEIDISIVKWALRTLSQLPLDHRPPGNDAHWSPTGRAEHNEVAVGGRDAEPPGRADGPAVAGVRTMVGTVQQLPAGRAEWSEGLFRTQHSRSVTSSDLSRNGQSNPLQHPEQDRNGPAGGPEHGRNGPTSPTKREQIEALVARLPSDQLSLVSAREVAAMLASEGTDVSERYVSRILSQRAAAAARRQ